MVTRDQILKDESLTFAEKIVSCRAGPGERVYRAGEVAVLPADLTMAQDSTAPLTIKILREMSINRVWDSSKLLLVIDHTYPASDEKVANMHQLMRSFAAEQGCRLIEGSISHQFILEEVAIPGMVVFGADSHTCQAGCLGAFATGIGSTEAASLWATGELWVMVPESFKVELTGEMPKGVFARDIVLHYIGEVGEDGANYISLEWKGPLARRLSIPERATISNNSMECGCKLSVFEVDDMTEEYLKVMGREHMLEVHAGRDAEFKDDFVIEANLLEPVIVGPDYMDRRHSVGELEGTPIDQAFIGSATNGSLDDLRVVARILKGRQVKKGTRCIVTPASRRVYQGAIQHGLAGLFLEAGAIFTNATCGACVGTHLGVLGEKEVCISSSSRNFLGRMGALSAKIFISSPATVAASAIEGKIADPRRYL